MTLIPIPSYSKISKRAITLLALLIFNFSALRADVTLTTTAVAASDVFQGTVVNVAYILQMDITGSSEQLTNFSMVSSGTYDSDDLDNFKLYRNTSPTMTGASLLKIDNTATGNGETVAFSTNYTFAVGTWYLIVTVDVAAGATDGNTTHFDGATNPAALIFTGSPIQTDNQSNNAGVQTIRAADVTYSTEVVAAADIFQNTVLNVTYIMRLDVAIASVKLDALSMATSGTYDSDDLDNFKLYRNTSPTMSGASWMKTDNTTTGNGETVAFNTNYTFAVGTWYLIVTVDVAAGATDGNTVHFNGAANPASPVFVTVPNVTDNQSNNAGVQTVRAADVTYSTEVVAATNILEGTTLNVTYIMRMDVATASVKLVALSMATSGTYDSDDLDNFKLYRNTSPTMSGASWMKTDNTTTGNGETADFSPSYTFAVGTWYLIITVDVAAAATQGNTVHFNGAASPAAPSFATAPNITDNQSNNAGVQTLGAPLPVELTNFKAMANEKYIFLEWETASESNNEGYEIQRSTNGKEWRALSFVDGYGSTTELQNYFFTDIAPVPGINYYRLKQIDLDGFFTLSSIVSTWFDGAYGAVRVYPNPATNLLNIRFPETIYDPVKISLFDTQGRLMEQQSISAAQSIDVEGLAPGMYLVKAVAGERVFSGRFTKF